MLSELSYGESNVLDSKENNNSAANGEEEEIEKSVVDDEGEIEAIVCTGDEVEKRTTEVQSEQHAFLFSDTAKLQEFHNSFLYFLICHGRCHCSESLRSWSSEATSETATLVESCNVSESLQQAFIKWSPESRKQPWVFRNLFDNLLLLCIPGMVAFSFIISLFWDVYNLFDSMLKRVGVSGNVGNLRKLFPETVKTDMDHSKLQFGIYLQLGGAC
ncbi:hypothetical protein RJT34_12865 [Clitoria ternatea]|uniref:Uncharacterized protein n=1 Tax=Clitoria ternatea TaxID=43366 RepID=A0AAN9JN04_CLITE